jgi:hypothetical protein
LLITVVSPLVLSGVVSGVALGGITLLAILWYFTDMNETSVQTSISSRISVFMVPFLIMFSWVIIFRIAIIVTG